VLVVLASLLDNRKRTTTYVGVDRVARLAGLSVVRTMFAYRELRERGLIWRRRVRVGPYWPYETGLTNPGRCQPRCVRECESVRWRSMRIGCLTAMFLLASAGLASADSIYWSGATSGPGSAMFRWNIGTADAPEGVGPANQVNVWGIALDGEGHALYWIALPSGASASLVFRSSLNGDSPAAIYELPSTSGTHGLRMTVDGDELYWADRSRGAIVRGSADGSGMLDIVDTGAEEPLALALDESAGKLYWSQIGSSNDTRIFRSNLDGSDIELLVSDAGFATGIALHAASNTIFWTEREDGRIRAANLDGTGIHDVVFGYSSVNSVIVDPVLGRILWTQQTPGSIYSANFDGSDVQLLLGGLRDPRDLAIGPTFSGSLPNPIPEPSTLVLVALALIAGSWPSWRRGMKKAVADELRAYIAQAERGDRGRSRRPCGVGASLSRATHP